MYQTYRNGFIEVVCGPMFAGKTEELIRRYKRLLYGKKKVVVFTPAIDDRYSKTEIVSHDDNRAKAYTISKSKEIFKYVDKEVDAVIIDEAQFYDMGIVDVCEELANKGYRVIVGGLDLDFRGEPFGPMPYLLAKAEFVTKLTAICPVTGDPATRTQRLINGKPAKYNDPQIVIGAEESYEARSRQAHKVPKK